MALDARKDILWRIYLLYVFICIFGFAIVFRIVKLQFVEGDMWKEKSPMLEFDNNGKKEQLDALFGDKWLQPFKDWIWDNFNLPVKTIE